MTIKKEVRVGMLGVAALVVLYLGFQFLKGLDVFSSENEFNVEFSNVQGLQASNPVTFNGVNVGRVMEITPDQTQNKVNVQLSINKDIKLNNNTIALLADDGLIGGKIIQLNIGQGDPLPDGGNIKGEIQQGITAEAMEKISPALNDLDSLLVNLNMVVKQFDKTGYAMNALMASAKQTSNGVNTLVATNSKTIGEVANNAAELTKKLSVITSGLDQQIKPILSNTATLTNNLNNLKLDETVSELNGTITGLKTVLNEINNGKGTLGQLTNNETLYKNLESTTATLDALLADLKKNPKRYVQFSLIERKNKNKEE